MKVAWEMIRSDLSLQPPVSSLRHGNNHERAGQSVSLQPGEVMTNLSHVDPSCELWVVAWILRWRERSNEHEAATAEWVRTLSIILCASSAPRGTRASTDSCTHVTRPPVWLFRHATCSNDLTTLRISPFTRYPFLSPRRYRLHGTFVLHPAPGSSHQTLK